MTGYDVSAIRRQFPSLELEQDGRPVAYFDGPGGTQVPERVIDAMVDYYRTANANDGGAFATSERSVALVASARAAVAALYGASSPDEIKFGYNMTTLTMHVSRSIAAGFTDDDEILVTMLDHEANVSPWQLIARDRNLVLRTVDVRPDDCTLDLDDLEAKLSPRTRLIAVGYASNAVGTINPVAEITRRAHAAGAWVYIDAVHYAPHGLLDVEVLDVDFLVTSPYKWFGPHLGALYGRAEILDELPAYKVRPAHDRFETGTPSFEAIVGSGAAVDYLASIGRAYGAPASPAGSAVSVARAELIAAMEVIRNYELALLKQVVGGLQAIPGVRLWGVVQPERLAAERAPTIALTLSSMTAGEAARALGQRGIFAWDGHFYAQALVGRLGLAGRGGLLRLGIVHYNTTEEVDRLLNAVDELATHGAARF